MDTTTAIRPAVTAPAVPAGWTRLTTAPIVAVLRLVLTSLLWRPLLAVVGPLHTEGFSSLPATPCVIVADHRSHADAIAIRVALARAGRHRVVAAAAEDHWFRGRLRGLVGVLGAGAFPFPREGEVGLDRAAALLRAGYDVVLFPQGSRDAGSTRWRCGAGRLALEAGAPIVPVRLYGTDHVLPKGARWPRPHPLSLAVGAPIRAVAEDDPTEVVDRARRSAYRAVLPAPVEGRLVGLSVRLRRTAVCRGVAVLAVWAFAEATVWPLIPDLVLAGMAFAVPRLAPRLAATTALASAAGGAVAVALGRAGLSWPMLAVTQSMRTGAAAAVEADGARGVLLQPLSGIPYKAFNAAAVQADVDLVAWAGWTVLARGTRMAVVVLVASMVGRVLWSRHVPDGWAPRLHSLVVLVGLVLFVLGWAAVIALWR